MKSIQILFLTTLLLPASPIEASGFFSWFRGAAPETTPAVQKKIPLSAQERLLKQVKNDVGLKNVATQFNKSQQQKSLGQPGITPYTLEQQLKNYTQQLEQKRRLYVTRANSTPNENRSYSKENPILFKEITDLENQIGTLREQSVMTRINALDNQTSAEDLNTLFKEISKNRIRVFGIQ